MTDSVLRSLSAEFDQLYAESGRPSIAQRFFAEVNRLAKRFMSDEHFTVDGTLIQAWASQKSFRPKDGSDDDDGTNFRGQKRSNDTHQSITDPDARLYKKSYGKESKLAYLGRVLVECLPSFVCRSLLADARSTATSARYQAWKRALASV